MRMGRRVIALALVAAVVVSGSVASIAQAGARDATAAATTCKAKNKKKCKKTKKKKTAAAAIKDGDYTYKQASAGSAPVNTLTISGKGTKIRIREQYFSSGEDPAGLSCASTMIDFGTLKLKKSGDYLMWSTAGTVTVPPIQTQGAGGGTATTSGEINIKTLVVNVNTDVVMKNQSGQNGSGCHEGHRYEGVQKLKRK